MKAPVAICAILLALPHLAVAQVEKPSTKRTGALDLAGMRRIGEVDERFQSYNIEMAEVTGGSFWKPYRLGPPKDADDRYANRPPINLASPRLRRLAAALSPAYVRVSGSWANTTAYVAAGHPGDPPPAGFSAIVTGAQWRGVVKFARATGAEIVTSFAASPGTRDPAGLWTPKEMESRLAATREAGGKVAAAEFINEPNLLNRVGAPVGYDAAAYGRDFRIFRAALKKASPDTLVLGPGSASSGRPADTATAGPSSPDMLRQAGAPEIVSYHHYGAVSQRCAPPNSPTGTLKAAALSEDWLSRPDLSFALYAQLRDQFAPGAPLWVTETAQAACGGAPWAATFTDSFRYADQLGRLAKAGVKVVMHNTLAASDYGLLDETTLEPRPNYWTALLWRRLMGRGVLDAGAAPSGVHLYAHCDPRRRGGVTVLAINLNAKPTSLSLAAPVQAYVLTAGPSPSLVRLNGQVLRLMPGDRFPALTSVAAGPAVSLPAQSLSFLSSPHAGAAGCRV
jgi:hypothetical protein